MIRDLLLPGDVGLRLVDAPAGVERAVATEVGPVRRAVLAAPEIVLRFVAALPVSGDLRSVGMRQAAYDDASFFVLDATGRRAALPIGSLGGPVEIAIETGFAGLPLLREAIDLRLLATGRVLLHSAAVTFGGRTVLVVGWQKGGKSEVLLSLMSAGGTFVADEWSVIEVPGPTATGLGDRLFVWDWHLDQVPSYRDRLPHRDRLRLDAVAWYRKLYRRLGAPTGRAFPLPLLGRAATPGLVPLLGQVHPRPETLFGSARAGTTRVDALLLATVADGPTRVERIPADEVADRMVASQAYERRHLTEVYAAFRYAFPERRNDLLEGSWERERSLLRAGLGGLPAWELRHPYPVDFEELRSVLIPEVFGPSTGAGPA